MKWVNMLHQNSGIPDMYKELKELQLRTAPCN